MLTPPVPFSFLIWNILQCETLPSNICADAPCHLTSCLTFVQMRHAIWLPEDNRGSRFFRTLFQLLHWIFLLRYLHWARQFKTFFWSGVSWIDYLFGWHLNLSTLLWAGNFAPLNTKNLLITVMFLWLNQDFMAGCFS